MNSTKSVLFGLTSKPLLLSNLGKFAQSVRVLRHVPEVAIATLFVLATNLQTHRLDLIVLYLLRDSE